jgi:EmrB/QacA subfamily drug resistance transporter
VQQTQPRFRWRDAAREAEPRPTLWLVRQSYYSWLVTGVLCVGAFLAQLDASIVQLALPALQRTFSATLEDVRWVATTYLLTVCAFLPVLSWVGEFFGRKLLYLTGLTLFAVASWLCGLAQDLTELVALRGLQGIGGALMASTSIGIIFKSVDPDKRERAMGLFTTAQAIGISIGPVAGGVVLVSLGWQWVFWITVPLGLAAALVGWFVLPHTADFPADRSFDWYGAAFLMPALALVILILNQLSVWQLTSPAMLVSTAAAVIFLALFLRRERATPLPLVDLSLFRLKAFSAGIVGVMLGAALLYGMFFVMSFGLVHGMRQSALVAGVKLSAIPVALALVAPLGVTLSRRFGSEAVGAAGMALCVAAVAVLSMVALRPGASHLSCLASLALFGAGLGLFVAPNSHATVDVVPASHSTAAGAMVNLMRAFGSCLGISAVSSIMSWRMRQPADTSTAATAFDERPLLAAVESSFALLVALALITAALALVRRHQSR